MSIWYRACACITFWLPLVGASRTLGQFPLVFEQVLEEVVTPFCRRAGPRDFQAAGNGVTCDAGGVSACPAEALLLDRRAFRLSSHVLVGTGSVGLAKGVTACDQGDGLFVVHGHALEGLADILGCRNRIRNAFRAFRIDINETHRGGAERVREIALTGIALVRSEPGRFNSPVDVEVWFPNVRTSAGETKGLKAHGFEGDIAGKDQQVGPRDLLSVFLLDWPKQTAGSIEVDVVRPAIEWSKTLLTSAAASAAVTRTVRTRTVPRHANK